MQPQKAGTTAKHQRRFWVQVGLIERSGWTDIDVPKMLAHCGMAQSISEGRRVLLEQNIVWFDNGIGKVGSRIDDRLQKLDEEQGLFNKRSFLVEPGMVVCVGRTVDEAICHRIEFL